MKNNILLVFIVLLSFGCEKASTDIDTPTITIADTTVTEEDNNSTVSITIQLDEPSEADIIFEYSTDEGTASSGSDYIAVVNKTFIISAGSTSASLEITIVGDTFSEPTEEFEVVLLNPVGATFSSTKVKMTIEDNDVTGGVVIPSAGYTTPDNYAGMTLIWQDEFDGPTISNDWIHETGRGNNGWGNNELQYYREQNTSIVNGHLVIEAKQEEFGGANYTSSRLVTQGQQNFKYGRVDIRAVLPKGQGMWPALWMLGDNFSSVGWPACGEIDIMEVVGHEPDKVHGTVHWDNNGQHANFGGSTSLSSGTFADEFHVFSITWDAQAIRWFLDDVQYHVIDISPAGLSEFQEEFFFIFNVAIGGNWPGNPDGSTVFPQHMIVDYVRVFQ